MTISPITCLPLCILVSLSSLALARSADRPTCEQDGADEEASATTATRVLAFADAKKKEIRHNMAGITSTRIFYTFPEAKAVITLNIDNASPKLPVTTKVTLFDLDTSEEGIAKWLNNQYSDGLYVDPAKPTHEATLPKGTSTVTERKLLGEEKSPINDAVFADYEVKIVIKEHIVPGKYKVPAFTDQAKVFLETK